MALPPLPSYHRPTKLRGVDWHVTGGPVSFGAFNRAGITIDGHEGYAIYGVDGTYDAKTPPIFRHALRRTWDYTLPAMLVIGVNPSTAGHEDNDPTADRCIHDAQRLGFGRLWMGNLHPYRSPKPEVMKAYYSDPADAILKATAHAINLSFLESMARQSDLIVCAWGDDGAFQGQSKIITEFLRRRVPRKPLNCWKMSEKLQEPRHRLYLPHGMTPILLP